MTRLRGERQKDLPQPALDQIIDPKHPLVLLGDQIDWDFLFNRLRTVCLPCPGRPGLPTRLGAGLSGMLANMCVEAHLRELLSVASRWPWSGTQRPDLATPSEATAIRQPS
jgi:hypothetical protein